MTTVNANNTTAAARFDVDAIRADFAALDQQVAGRPLIYMDNAATSQKPRPVIDTIDDYYRRYNANVHRGAHRLSVLSTEAFEHARQSVARFFHVGDDRLVVFTRGTTDAINLVATSYGSMALEPGDNVLLTGMEHHSNIVPWQLACERAGADLRVLPVTDRGELDMDQLDRLIDRRTRLVAAVHVSNALGTINPVERLVEAGHAVGAVVLVDGAQAVPHTPVDLNALGADFYAFSAHKALGPTGIGALVGRAELLQRMPPYQGGGEMIESVSFEKTTFADAPARFEAGTPHIAGAIGMGAALDYLAGLDRAGVERHEQQLLARATERLGAIPGLRLIGTAERKTCVLSFVVDSIGAYDLGNLLDGRGIAVRTGHHCTQPLMERYGVPATCRASMALYNTTGEVDALADALEQIVASFGEKARAATAAPASEPAGADVRFPAAAADCPDEAAEQVLEDFEFLEDWEQRYQYLLDLGSKLPAMPQAWKTEDHRVHGCQSTVHLVLRRDPDDAERVQFVAESDSALVQGLIGLLQRVFSGQRAGDVLGFDVERFFTKLGLEQHLTMGRRNGLHAMVGRLRTLAGEQEPA